MSVSSIEDRVSKLVRGKLAAEKRKALGQGKSTTLVPPLLLGCSAAPRVDKLKTTNHAGRQHAAALESPVAAREHARARLSARSAPARKAGRNSYQAIEIRMGGALRAQAQVAHLWRQHRR